MRLIILVIIVSMLSCKQAHKPNPATIEAFNSYLDRKFDEGLHRNPEFASSLGYRYHYDQWTDRSFENARKELKESEAVLDSMKRFNQSELDSACLLSYKLYEEEVKNSREAIKWEGYSYELTQMGGVVTDMPAFLINVHSVDSMRDAEDYLGRLRNYYKPFRQTMDNLRISKNKGITPPAFTLTYVKESLESLITSLQNSENNDLLIDFKAKVNKLSNISQEQKAGYIKTAKTLLRDSVLSAHIEMLSFWNEYSKSITQSHGAWSLPKGEEYYKYCLKDNTTLDLSPEEVYKTGLEEVARIHNEMRVIMKKVKYKNDSLQSFFNFVRNDAQFQYPDNDAGRKALLADATRYFDETNKRLPEIFNIKPKAPCVVMAVEKFREKSVGGAFYENPTLDGKRPGRYYVNLYSMKDNPKYQLEALTAHEAIPGHHMQIAIAQELTNVPNFRKHGGNTAYIEGWALYSELLNKELGYYQDPYSDFGRLSMEIFRAARLVVDVGIHYKKWSREQAIDYFMKNTANAEGDIKHEIERYFIWPGQATGYKIGMIKIMELREKSKKKLGSKFDIRKFHDVILKNGSVPLNILEELVMNMEA